MQLHLFGQQTARFWPTRCLTLKTDLVTNWPCESLCRWIDSHYAAAPVARSLRLDYAPAMVGKIAKNGFDRPIFQVLPRFWPRDIDHKFHSVAVASISATKSLYLRTFKVSLSFCIIYHYSDDQMYRASSFVRSLKIKFDKVVFEGTEGRKPIQNRCPDLMRKRLPISGV